MKADYSKLDYRHAGCSGLRLPPVALGLWHNFGDGVDLDKAERIITTAFENGITHFDLANNYGPEPGSAERNFGVIMSRQMKSHRDEVIISSKAGYIMWDGPYGDGGSRKYLIASCDQSLKRMKLDYVDIFYHHRMDAETPVEESMQALADIVHSGKALYAGISNYSPEQAAKAFAILRDLKTPCVLHQVRYNMFDRTHERAGSFRVMQNYGVGGIVFSPMAQGLLTDRYLNGIPQDSRATHSRFLHVADVTEAKLAVVRKLNALAQQRGQPLAAMSIAWVLNQPGVTTALFGASKPEQVTSIIDGLNANRIFSSEELQEIEAILA